jgi:aldehyde:ferredoxin oxidoreductase
MYGWMDKILHVDLSNSRITQSPTQPYTGPYLGGRGIASRIYAEMIKPGVKPFDPENPLIFINGTFVGTGSQGSNGMEVVGRSPGPVNEGYCFANINGFIGAELKKAGFDGIVITGRAPKPVYLWVHDREAEIKDASEMWGQNAYRTGEMLQQRHGEKTRFLAIGVSGENLVRTAVALASHHCTISAGFGAVMGAKNLKGVVVRGTGKIPVADPEKLRELVRYTIKIGNQRIVADMPPEIRYVEIVRKGGSCYQCGFECVRNVYRYGGRPELEANRRCQVMVYYKPWKYGREDEPIETFFDAPTLANDYALESFELERIIDWLYAGYKEGVLTEPETGLPLSRIGTREFLEKLLHAIAYREGFGDILAEGLWRAGEKVSREARALFSPSLAPVGVRESLSPRAAIVQALLYQMEPRGHQATFHEVAQTMGGWMLNQHQPELSPITTEVVYKIARAFWGSEAAGDFSSYEGKALAARTTQNRICFKDSLGLCDFTWPIMYSFDTPDHVGDPHLEAKIYAAVTGIADDEVDLDRCGERIFNLQRVIMLREGRQVPEADYPLEHNFTELLKAGGTHGVMMVPGPNKKPIDVTGNTLDRDKFVSMLQEYYRLRGWDEATGLPRPETLSALGLGDLMPASLHV